MPSFIVDTAVTCISRERQQGAEAEFRMLEVEGAGEAGGRNRARFMFDPGIDGRHAGPVGYMTGTAAGGLSLIGWLPLHEYEVYRVIVESGVPLAVHYETRDGGTGYLRRLALGRADAPPIVIAACRRVATGGVAPMFAMPL